MAILFSPFEFLLADYDYIVYAFQFHVRRLRLYCLGPFSFLLADYGYIV
jgi:hypothetical protein